MQYLGKELFSCGPTRGRTIRIMLLILSLGFLSGALGVFALVFPGEATLRERWLLAIPTFFSALTSVASAFSMREHTISVHEYGIVAKRGSKIVELSFHNIKKTKMMRRARAVRIVKKSGTKPLLLRVPKKSFETFSATLQSALQTYQEQQRERGYTSGRV